LPSAPQLPAPAVPFLAGEFCVVQSPRVAVTGPHSPKNDASDPHVDASTTGAPPLSTHPHAAVWNAVGAVANATEPTESTHCPPTELPAQSAPATAVPGSSLQPHALDAAVHVPPQHTGPAAFPMQSPSPRHWKQLPVGAATQNAFPPHAVPPSHLSEPPTHWLAPWFADTALPQVPQLSGSVRLLVSQPAPVLQSRNEPMHVGTHAAAPMPASGLQANPLTLGPPSPQSAGQLNT
jgi:hypothetical protein